MRYTYGGPNAEHNRVGRIALQEDGSGAQEFFYGRLGEVTKTRRTLIIPNVAVATYTTEWKYDSHGRLLEMTYPDGEKIIYNYDLGGNLCKVFGKKNYLYTYIDTIAYDLFGQRSYIRYGNGAETRYSYSTNRRRLSNLTVNANNVKVMDNTYKYDVMDNITSLVNAGKPQTLQSGKTIGGTITHTYSYDEWDRLIKATGTFNGGGSKSATYDLRMEYDKLYNITSKQLNLTQNNLQFAGSLKTGYTLNYNYKEDDPFRLESIDSKEFSSESDTLRRVTNYDFDGNGNLTLQLVDTQQDSAHCADTMGTKVKNHLWDEENRLLAINDNGFVSNYFYDAAGERTVKLSKPDLFVYVNSSEKLKGDSLPVKFVGYVSPYLVVTNGGRYTKHIYAGTQRIASKLGDIDAFGADPRRVATAGHDVENIEPIDFGTKYKNQNDAFKSRFDSLGAKFNGKSLDDYVNGKSFCCGDKNLDEIEQNNTQSAENAKLEDNLYFYHPDHLGSTSMVTNYDGEVTQNVAYIPYGEVFVEERNGNWATPFLFNAKELDEETGLYYYGARYYDPTNVAWLSVDPMFEEEAGKSPYSYCAGNPIRYTDPTGMVKCDENGNVIFTPDEKAEKVINGEKMTIYSINNEKYVTQATYQPGFIYTEDDGTPVPALMLSSIKVTDKDGNTQELLGNEDLQKSMGKNQISKSEDLIKAYKTNCHGLAYADGQVWINDEDVSTIISKEWHEIDPAKQQVKDVTTFYYYDAAAFEKGKLIPLYDSPAHSITNVSKYGESIMYKGKTRGQYIYEQKFFDEAAGNLNKNKYKVYRKGASK